MTSNSAFYFGMNFFRRNINDLSGFVIREALSDLDIPGFGNLKGREVGEAFVR